eukprot:TCONS_00000928-protein
MLRKLLKIKRCLFSISGVVFVFALFLVTSIIHLDKSFFEENQSNLNPVYEFNLNPRRVKQRNTGQSQLLDHAFYTKNERPQSGAPHPPKTFTVDLSEGQVVTSILSSKLKIRTTPLQTKLKSKKDGISQSNIEKASKSKSFKTF